MADAETVQTSSDTVPDTKTVVVDDDAIAKAFEQRVKNSCKDRDTRLSEWQDNIRRRIGQSGKVAASSPVGQVVATRVEGANRQSEYSPDWELTKAKTANIWSQLPRVFGSSNNARYRPAVGPFLKQLNYEIGEQRANVGAAMKECSADVVNASGIASAFIYYASRSVPTQIVKEDTRGMTPEQIQQGLATGALHMVDSQKVVDRRFVVSKVSPSDLIIPDNFDGSDFDKGDFIGHEDSAPWVIAKEDFKLTDEDKAAVINSDRRNQRETLRVDNDNRTDTLGPQVRYTEIFYWRYLVDPDEPSFSRIWRIVWVKGKTDPAIHEPWECQEFDPQSYTLVGPARFPIQVVTLTYITGNPYPPSDTRAGAPQVDDMRLSRAQMFMNRARSVPMRWYNTNLVDPLIQQALRNGTFQGWIPTNGDGSRVVGEVARASYPSEDLTFDRTAAEDLRSKWMLGSNQVGDLASGRKTKAEVETVQSNFATLIGNDRACFTQFFLRICDVVAGLLCRYSDFNFLSPEEKQAMQSVWDEGHIHHSLVFRVLPDSTIAVDPNQRINVLARHLNLTAQSGFVNPKPIIEEMTELSGLDPSEVVIDPQPKEEKPNISWRFSGKQDLTNVMAVALLAKGGWMPSPEELQAAAAMIQKANELAAQAMSGAAPVANGAVPPLGPGGAVPPPTAPAGPPLPQPPAHPDWEQTPKVAKRSREV